MPTMTEDVIEWRPVFMLYNISKDKCYGEAEYCRIPE